MQRYFFLFLFLFCLFVCLFFVFVFVLLYFVLVGLRRYTFSLYLLIILTDVCRILFVPIYSEGVMFILENRTLKKKK